MYSALPSKNHPWRNEMEISAAATPSCFARMKAYLCKKETTDNMLIMASMIGATASTIIPIRPLAGVLAGANFFVFVHKAFSTGYPTQFAPRTWTQLAIGFTLSTAVMTIAFSVPIMPYGVPTFLAAVVLGPYTTYNKCWELYRRPAAAPPLPHYAAVPDAPPPTTPPVSAAAG